MAQDFQTIPNDVSGVQEGRNFTNPLVRFRRIRGRVVPIYNKKRLGQETSKIGNKALRVGAVLSAVTAVKGLGGKMKFTKSMGKFSLGKLSNPFTRAAGRTMGFGFKHSGKLAAASMGVGVLAKFLGTEVEATSQLGYDIGAEE